MPNSQKLLYILPDLAYVVDLLPTKKEYTFTVQSFRQINGQFLDDNEFIEKNLDKLADKLDDDTYQVVLPDFLFTNTIVGVKESSEAKVKEHLKDKLLPSLGLDEKTHEIETIILTQHKDEFKVQLSALEKSVLEPLKVALKGKNVVFSSIIPLSWTVKSIVSLEPSITIVQLGAGLYLAQQYIGLDQTIYAPVSDAENLVETVKTLKGAEPSIQTLYLLASELVEEKLREGLADVLPIQQLASFKEKETDMPSYVKQVIEAGARTLVIPDFSLPKFSLGKITEISVKAEPIVDVKSETKIEEEEEVEALTEEIALPQPSVAKSSAEEKTEEILKEEIEIVREKIELQVSVEKEPEKPKEDEPMLEVQKDENLTEDINLGQFVAGGKIADLEREIENEKKEVDMEKKETKIEAKKIIKDNSGVNGMLKMFFVGLISFFATVGIGVGLGLGFLSLSNKNQEIETPVAEVVTPSPVIEEEPSPTPAPEIVRKDYKVLVVNATTTAGYAGEKASDLEEAGFEDVGTGNAKGDYDEGTFVLMAEENKDLLDTIAKDLDMKVTYQIDIKTEDTKEAYDVVVVLAE